MAGIHPVNEWIGKDTTMPLPKKTVTCPCGFSIELQKDKDWCDKCGRPVFYHQKAQIRHRMNTCFITLILLSGIGVFTYFFIEMVLAHFY